MSWMSVRSGPASSQVFKFTLIFVQLILSEIRKNISVLITLSEMMVQLGAMLWLNEARITVLRQTSFKVYQLRES